MQVITVQALRPINRPQKRLLARVLSVGTLFALTALAIPASVSTAQDSGDETDKPKKNREKEGRKGKKPADSKEGPSMNTDSPEGARRPGFKPPGGFGGQGRPGQGGPGLGMMMKFLPIMIALDTDSDGELSASEIENASKALRSLDKDGNGSITIEELRPDPSKMMSNMPPEMRERMQERMKGEGKDSGKGRKRGDGDGSGVLPKRPE